MGFGPTSILKSVLQLYGDGQNSPEDKDMVSISHVSPVCFLFPDNSSHQLLVSTVFTAFMTKLANVIFNNKLCVTKHLSTSMFEVQLYIYGKNQRWIPTLHLFSSAQQRNVPVSVHIVFTRSNTLSHILSLLTGNTGTLANNCQPVNQCPCWVEANS